MDSKSVYRTTNAHRAASLLCTVARWITMSLLRPRRDPDEGKHHSPRTFSCDSCAPSRATRMVTLKRIDDSRPFFSLHCARHSHPPTTGRYFLPTLLSDCFAIDFTRRVFSPGRGPSDFPSLCCKESRQCPSLRASREHILIVRPRRARRMVWLLPSLPSHPPLRPQREPSDCLSLVASDEHLAS